MGSPSLRVDEKIRAKNVTKPLNAAIPVIERSGDGVYYLSNNLPYIRRLEYEGHSGQAPNGMVRVTMAKADKILKAQARKANKKPKI